MHGERRSPLERILSFAHSYAKSLMQLVLVLLPSTVVVMEPPVESPQQHCQARPNSLCPTHMSTDARLAELGRILAAGVLRLRDKSSALSADGRDSLLAILPARSVSRPRAKIRIGGR